MYPSTKPETAAMQPSAGFGAFIGTVASLVAGAIVIVPLGAFYMVRWAVGTVYDALRSSRDRE